MRRVLLHLGLHKTGMTAAQSFLYENRELIWPHYSLVLPYKTRKNGLSEAATRHSVYRLDATLSEFGSRMNDFLGTIDFGTSRGLILSEENFAGLRPSRNSAEGYGSATELAKSLIEVIRHRFDGEEVEFVVHLSLRQRGSWLRSLWAHDLRHTRLVLGFEDYRSKMEHLPTLQDTANEFRTALPSVIVKTEWLEELQERRYGPGTPFAEFLNLPRGRSRRLVPPKKSSPVLQESLLEEMLTLNRSALDDTALVAQKKALIRSAGIEMVSQK